MNKQRRAQIDALIKTLETLKGQVEDAMNEADSIATDERDYFDNMPENMQQGDRGQAAEQAADQLEEARSNLENMDFEEVISNLETAKEG